MTKDDHKHQKTREAAARAASRGTALPDDLLARLADARPDLVDLADRCRAALFPDQRRERERELLTTIMAGAVRLGPSDAKAIVRAIVKHYSRET